MPNYGTKGRRFIIDNVVDLTCRSAVKRRDRCGGCVVNVNQGDDRILRVLDYGQPAAVKEPYCHFGSGPRAIESPETKHNAFDTALPSRLDHLRFHFHQSIY
jgi:hypothetical protein